jgi:hypothetical protein
MDRGWLPTCLFHAVRVAGLWFVCPRHRLSVTLNRWMLQPIPHEAA